MDHCVETFAHGDRRPGGGGVYVALVSGEHRPGGRRQEEALDGVQNLLCHFLPLHVQSSFHATRCGESMLYLTRAAPRKYARVDKRCTKVRQQERMKTTRAYHI